MSNNFFWPHEQISNFSYQCCCCSLARVYECVPLPIPNSPAPLLGAACHPPLTLVWTVSALAMHARKTSRTPTLSSAGVSRLRSASSWVRRLRSSGGSPVTPMICMKSLGEISSRNRRRTAVTCVKEWKQILRIKHEVGFIKPFCKSSGIWMWKINPF